MQEGRIGLLISYKSYNGSVKFSTYAYKSIYWSVLKYHMKEKKHKIQRIKTEISCDEARLDSFTLSEGTRKLLSDEEYEVLDMVFHKSLSIKEIATILKVSKSTIYRRYNKLLDKIKKYDYTSR